MNNNILIIPNEKYEDVLSPLAVEIHFFQHHKKYLSNLLILCESFNIIAPNNMKSLKEFAIKYKNNNISLYNNAAQIMNHNIFWETMNDKQNNNDTKRFLNEKHNFTEEFRTAANKSFGSMWIWLVFIDNQFKVVSTENAHFPAGELILNLDLWEHSFYVDYYSKKSDFIENFIENGINWDLVAKKISLF